MEFQHKRQQWPVGHGFFHTASVSVNGTTYRYVYDCGAAKKVTIEQQVDRYSKNEELENRPNELDMVVISHFHADHIKGLPHLFSKFKVKKLVIPYLAKNFKLVALAHLASSGPNVWTDLSGLVIDPADWLSRQDQDTEIVEIADEGGEPFDVPNIPNDGNGVSLGVGRVNHSSAGAIFSAKQAFWTFKFYVQNLPSIAIEIVQKLVDEFGCTEDQLQQNLENISWVEANWQKVKDHFNKLGSNKQNATSLCMYSGTNDRLEFDLVRHSSSLGSCSCKYRYYYHWPSGIGWIGTGDAEFKDVNKTDAFVMHFGNLLDRTDTLTIPHHGSKDNYNARLGDIGVQHIITSDHIVDPKDHHPASEVMTNLQTKSDHVHIVSLEECTALFERFNGYLEI